MMLEGLMGQRFRKALAWGVHLITSLGFPIAFAAYLALTRDVRLFFLLEGAAVVVDGVDGFLARRWRVGEVLPEFDGRKLDDLVDFLTYVFLPVIALWELDLLPSGYGWLAILPLMASGYGFSQQRAKTDESFVGFPSYWNVLVFYQYMLGWDKTLNAVLVVVLAVLVFVPIHYIYPSKTKMLKGVTLALVILWGMMVFVSVVAFDSVWVESVLWWSLIVPFYYMVLSMAHHRKMNQ